MILFLEFIIFKVTERKIGHFALHNVHQLDNWKLWLDETYIFYDE